eukprot:COSAG04_NODE_1530_length_6451_cov_2.039830_7_plen_126_part_01
MLTAAVAFAAAAAVGEKWEQPVVAVGICTRPPPHLTTALTDPDRVSADLPGTYAETQDLGGKSVAAVMAAHGFTFSFGLGHTNDTVAECTKHKLGCLVSKSDIPTAAGASLPPAAVWGYNIGDEPG